MRSRPPRASALVALFALGLLVWNFPLLIVWDGAPTVLGLPALPLALFVTWAGLIAVLAWISERGE